MLFGTLSAESKKSIMPIHLALLCVWFAGILLGLHIASFFGANYYVYYYTAAREPAGFAGLFAVFFLPFGIVALIFYFRNLFYLFPIAALMAINLGFNQAMLRSAFGQGAWLVRVFLQFSGVAVSILLMWLIWIGLNDKKVSLQKYCIFYSVASFFLTLIDYYFISAFFSDIL